MLPDILVRRKRGFMELIKENERSANKAAAKVMMITAVIYIAILILDVVGIFDVKVSVMVVSYIISTVLLLMPTLVNLVCKNGGGWIKYFIVVCAILFTVIC